MLYIGILLRLPTSLRYGGQTCAATKHDWHARAVEGVCGIRQILGFLRSSNEVWNREMTED